MPGALRDSTISVVVSFVLLFSTLKDYSSADVHVAGLRQIVHLHGGIESFRDNPGLYIKLGRLVHLCCLLFMFHHTLKLTAISVSILLTFFILERSLSSSPVRKHGLKGLMSYRLQKTSDASDFVFYSWSKIPKTKA